MEKMEKNISQNILSLSHDPKFMCMWNVKQYENIFKKAGKKCINNSATWVKEFCNIWIFFF